MSQFTTLKIYYGLKDQYREVTDLVLQSFAYVNGQTLEIIIPEGDVNRAAFFTDHLPGQLKNVKLIFQDQEVIIMHDQNYELVITNLSTEEISAIHQLKKPEYHGSKDLNIIHKNLKFLHGNLRDEYPEQLMATKFIASEDCVLELGSNIGRNTLTIACLLSDSRNLVTLECDAKTCKLLKTNRNINNYNFHVEDSALSSRKLIQKGWDTIPSEILLPGYTPVKTITFEDLEKKYNKQFNVLVADCEGALYYILQDFPQMLKNINKVLMENDYHQLEHKQLVDQILVHNGFKKVYAAGGGWGVCAEYFFETWIKG